jgi:hypothetical protein
MQTLHSADVRDGLSGTAKMSVEMLGWARVSESPNWTPVASDSGIFMHRISSTGMAVRGRGHVTLLTGGACSDEALLSCYHRIFPEPANDVFLSVLCSKG